MNMFIPKRWRIPCFPETCQWNGWTKHVSWVSDLILPLASSVGRKPRPPSLIVMRPTQSGNENSKPTFTQLPCFSALREDWDRAGERAHATSGQWARFRPSDCYFMLPYYSVSRKCVCNPASIFVFNCRPYCPHLSYRIYSNKRRCAYQISRDSGAALI